MRTNPVLAIIGVASGQDISHRDTKGTKRTKARSIGVPRANIGSRQPNCGTLVRAPG